MNEIKFKYWGLNRGAAFGTTDLTSCLGKLTDTNGCTVLLCTQGYAIVSINLKRYKLSAGSIAILPFDMSFIPISCSANFEVRYISLSVNIVDDIAYHIASSFWDYIYLTPVLSTTDNQYQSMLNWYSNTEWMIENCVDEFLVSSLKNCFFNLLVGIYSEVKQGGEEQFVSYEKKRSWKLIGQFYILLSRYHYRYRDVKFYAEKMNISPDYLYKLLYKIDGISPKEAIERQVIVTLKTYLQSTDLSVKSISNALNFEDVSYMCRFFRKMTGMSPTQFRKESH